MKRVPRPPPRGFTLIEALTVVAILGALVTITILGFASLKKRGDFASATGDLIVGLRATRSAAYGRGNSTVFVVDTFGGRWWGIEDLNSAFTLAAFNPGNPAPAGYNLIVSGTLPVGVTFTGATTGFGGFLPQPYAGVVSNNGNFPYCSFCQTGGAPGPGFGAIQFRTNGGATFLPGSTVSNLVGQSMTLQGDATSAVPRILTIAVIQRTGTTETFQP